METKKEKETPEERKARLRKLRQAQQEALDSDTKKRKRDEPEPVIKFRNYKPTNEDLKEKVVVQEVVTEQPSIEMVVEKQLAEAAPDGDIVDESGQVDLLNLAPRKIDWDLKRDLNAKLEKLQRRTNRAIAEILREKLGAESQ
eukprot:m.337545 g.337545  ORF g.337545 m.337545 type:complete len:143 (+) comp18160_c0_seq1:71-499(+)